GSQPSVSLPTMLPESDSGARLGRQFREHRLEHLARESEGIFHFVSRRLLKITRIPKCPCEDAEAIGPHADRFEAGIVGDAKAADRCEVVRLPKREVVPAQVALQGLLGGLLAMVGGFAEEGWRCRQEHARSPEIVFRLDE